MAAGGILCLNPELTHTIQLLVRALDFVAYKKLLDFLSDKPGTFESPTFVKNLLRQERVEIKRVIVARVDNFLGGLFLEHDIATNFKQKILVSFGENYRF